MTASVVSLYRLSSPCVRGWTGQRLTLDSLNTIFPVRAGVDRL